MSGSRFCTCSTSSAIAFGSRKRRSTAHVSHILLASSVIDFLLIFWSDTRRGRGGGRHGIAGASAEEDSVHATVTSSISGNSRAHNPLTGSHYPTTTYTIVSRLRQTQKPTLCSCIFTRFQRGKPRSRAVFFTSVMENRDNYNWT